MRQAGRQFNFACALLVVVSAGAGCEPKNMGGPVAVIEGEAPVHGLLGVAFAKIAEDPPTIVSVLPNSPAARIRARGRRSNRLDRWPAGRQFREFAGTTAKNSTRLGRDDRFSPQRRHAAPSN